MAWVVKFFQTSRGDYPVKDLIEEQDNNTQTKITHLIELLMNHGPYLKPPYIRKVNRKLYELRISGKIAIRIFYTMVNNEYYLLHAFKKKTNKILSKELKTALDRTKKII